jgi:hypothetical protein
VDYPCEVKIPVRSVQLEFFRWFFVASYALIAALATSILMTVTDDGGKWVGNLILDGLLLLIFIVYAKNAHVHDVREHEPCLFYNLQSRIINCRIFPMPSRTTCPRRSSSRTRASSPSPAGWRP